MDQGARRHSPSRDEGIGTRSRGTRRHLGEGLHRPHLLGGTVFLAGILGVSASS